MAPKRGRLGRRSAKGASTPLPTLSVDIFFEILSWLPLRSLSRSRCVCRSWRVLISNSAFVAAQRSRAHPLLVAATNSGSWTSTLQIMDAGGDVARFVALGGFWKFRASLDSLVLLTDGPAVRVMDLATGETIASCQTPHWVAAPAYKLTTWFGFGRAAQSGALKVVCIFYHDHLTCHVQTLGDNGGSEWRQKPPPSYMLRDSNEAVEVNGVLHFLSICQGHILGFDLESEEWTAISGPSSISPSPWEKIVLAELKGAPCIAHAKRNMVNLWLLTDLNKEDWVKVYTIKVGHFVDLVPLSVMRHSEKLLFYCRHGYGSVLQIYDPRSKKLEKVPTDIVGRIGLCSSRLDLRYRVESITDVDFHMPPIDLTSSSSMMKLRKAMSGLMWLCVASPFSLFGVTIPKWGRSPFRLPGFKV